jgi:hypothetical protein
MVTAYASKHGGTLEIASGIGVQLEKDGFLVALSADGRVGISVISGLLSSEVLCT